MPRRPWHSIETVKLRVHLTRSDFPTKQTNFLPIQTDPQLRGIALHRNPVGAVISAFAVFCHPRRSATALRVHVYLLCVHISGNGVCHLLCSRNAQPKQRGNWKFTAKVSDGNNNFQISFIFFSQSEIPCKNFVRNKKFIFDKKLKLKASVWLRRKKKTAYKRRVSKFTQEILLFG